MLLVTVKKMTTSMTTTDMISVDGFQALINALPSLSIMFCCWICEKSRVLLLDKLPSMFPTSLTLQIALFSQLTIQLSSIREGLEKLVTHVTFNFF
jgi:hypothetical protein